MSNSVTLEEVERLVTQRPAPERLKLVAHVCEQLATAAPREAGVERIDREHLARVNVWLADCDAVAKSIEGEFDAAEELRDMREARANEA